MADTIERLRETPRLALRAKSPLATDRRNPDVSPSPPRSSQRPDVSTVRPA
jgi:hypothetical protein